MGSNGYYSLLKNHKKRLNKIGDELRYLHPFKFLGYIFSNPDLKNHMATIFNDWLLKPNFLGDFPLLNGDSKE